MEMPARGPNAWGIEDMFHDDGSTLRLSQVAISGTGGPLCQNPGANGP